MAQISFVLVEPREEGNIGMVARAMANFGLESLVIVGAPALPGPQDFVVARREGRVILDSLRRADSLREAIAEMHAAVAVSRRRGKHRNPDMGPSEALTFVEGLPVGCEVAFVFGREADGLTLDEVAQCARVLAIPAAETAPSLNLALAAGITAYLLYPATVQSHINNQDRDTVDESELPARQWELDEIFRALEISLGKIGFLQGDRAEDSMTAIKRLLSRAVPTRRESSLLRSLVRKL